MDVEQARELLELVAEYQRTQDAADHQYGDMIATGRDVDEIAADVAKLLS